jgi:UDP-N-acetylmuramyl pentapeptide phosphotransferase/UDP-N-acetylglucosamine-1-phosphate transferase
MLYILLTILLFGAQLAYFNVAERFSIIDKPNERSSHKGIILRGGGIIFYIAVLLYFSVSGFRYPWFFAGLTVISLISFADDVKALTPRLRLIIQFAGLFLVFHQWNLYSSPWYYILIALVLSAGILNAFNFMDGINGITGAYSMAVLGAFWFINNYTLQFVDNQLIYIVLISLLVFNFFNFRKKAKCFAGDVGSVTIAVIVVFLLGQLILKTRNFSYIVFLAVYGVDSVLTILHRLKLKENIFEPHRKHLFQLLANELKIPHLQVSALYAILQLIIALGLLYFPQYGYLYLIVVVLLLSSIYLYVKGKIYHLHKQN